MKLLIVLNFLCGLVFAYPSSDGWQLVQSPLEHPRYQKLLSTLYGSKNIDQVPIRGGRIVGGQPAIPGEFPYQIYGYFNDIWLCGGSIISENWILTAAHCSIGASFVYVYIGSIDRSTRAPYEYRVSGAENIILHSDYNDTSLWNDISLIRTPLINFNENIGKVLLPSIADNDVDLEGFLATTSGFGFISDSNSSPSAILLYVNDEIISNEECELTFGPEYLLETNICKNGKNGRASCGGDSGGPMVSVIDGRKVQIGVVSYGAKSGCEKGFPSVYTRVSEYLSWINSQTDIPILN